MNRLRIDALLVARNLASSRTQAQKMLCAGQVKYRQHGDWVDATKASQKLFEDVEFDVDLGLEQRYVSRAGIKLAHAIEVLSPMMRGVVALDIGQSTGGFTDCLLQRGVADQVVGVDVGRNQLAKILVNDPRVVSFEGVNARALPVQKLLHLSPGGYPLVVMDVSFISQVLILPEIKKILAPGGTLISLVKPQFEVGRAAIGKGGIVKSEQAHKQVEADIRSAVNDCNLTLTDYFDSPIAGGDGNKEYFFIARSAVSQTI